MPDLQRIGGLTEMRNVQAGRVLSHAHLDSHFYRIQPVHSAGSENCISVEHVDWYGIVYHARSNQRRYGKDPAGAGTGFIFDDARIAEYGF